MMDTIRHIAQALVAAQERAEAEGDEDGFNADDAVRVIIAVLRKPAVLEALCRKAADPETGLCVAYTETSVHRAVDIVDAVLAAALLAPLGCDQSKEPSP